MPGHVRLAQYYAFDLDGNVFSFPDGMGKWDGDAFTEAMETSVEPGPAFGDLAEAFNRGSVIFVITGRGVPVAKMAEGFRRFFLSDRARGMGIDRGKFLAAMDYYFELTGTRLPSAGEAFEDYLDYYLGLCDFYPVSDPQVSCLLSAGDETDVAKMKSAAMRMTLRSVVNLAAKLPGFPKPRLAFSDDAPASEKALMEKFYGQASGVTFSVCAVQPKAPKKPAGKGTAAKPAKSPAKKSARKGAKKPAK
jgi:hypothetical protein